MTKNSISKVVANMVANPAHQTKPPSELIRKCTAYRNLTSDEINSCKEMAYGTFKSGNNTLTVFDKPTITEVDNNQDSSKYTIASPTPLSNAQLAELIGADGITTFIDRVWSKSHKNGSWTYSILTVTKINNFYSEKELKARLSTLLPKISSVKIPVIKNTSGFTTLCISDDHVGMLVKESIFGDIWSEEVYSTRLNSIIPHIPVTSELVIFSLGDQLHSWSGYTTRGGHQMPSETNRQMFDSYVKARKSFYDNLFTSKKANKYTVVEVNNSNHCGLGHSYMANALLKLYVETKYPGVNFINEDNFITKIQINNHLILATHGKDDTHQKSGFPKNLDARTENYFTDYLVKHRVDLNKTHVSLYKGDLHIYNENEGKNFRYVNVPSMANPSDWAEANFGTSKPGALIEVFTDDPEPFRKVVRFK